MLKQRHKKQWVTFAFVMAFLYFSGWYVANSYFQQELDIVKNDSRTEFNLISVLVRERLQKRDYQSASNFIVDWGRQSPSIHAITLTAKNGFEISNYKSQQKAKNILVEKTEISFSYNSLAVLELHKNIDGVHSSQKIFKLQLVAGYLLILSILFYLVYINQKTHDQKRELEWENENRKKVEKKLQEREENLAITLNSIGDAVITTDRYGCVTRMNPVAEHLTAWKSEEAMGKHITSIFKIVDASTNKKIENPVNKVISTGETVKLSNHTTLIARDGVKYQISDSAAPIQQNDTILGMVLVFNDVTEQYQLRSSLRESEKKLQLIHSQIPGIVYQFKIDGDGNKSFPYVSPAVREHVGLTDKEVMADVEKWLELVHPEDYPGLEESLLASLKNLSNWEWEGRFVLADGKVAWLRGVSTPERISDGGTIWNGVLLDVTESRLQEDQLRQSQKMDALGKLTGGIAHDYNNILGIIQGYAELLNEELQSNPNLLKYSEDIYRAAERGSNLTRKLLVFSRHQTPDRSVLNINDLLNKQQLMLEKTLTALISLNFDLQDELWCVDINGGDFEDTIINMCINAAYAMPSGGQITLRTRNQQLNEIDAEQLQLMPGDYVSISITDTGCGMDEETKEKLFDPFYTTKGSDGTGLGLSQVYGFVERAGGAIKVYSERGQGSRFALYFPRSTQTVAEDYVPRNEVKNDLSGNETILVVDDERSLVELAENILSRQGYNVLTAFDGKEALATLKNSPVDLVISDVIMPKMDGYQLASHIQEFYPSIKIQMISGFADKRHHNMSSESLHENILFKPYTSTVLLKHVRNLLDQDVPKNNLNGRTILVMDDDEDAQALYQLNLKKLGCNIIMAANGNEAIHLYKESIENKEPIDAVILDLAIPGNLSGKDVSEKIHTLNPQSRVIVSSGHSEGPEMLHCEDFGFQGVLTKDFDRKNMKRVLEEVIFD